MILPCGLQMGGRLLWACVLFFNLHYRVIFFPQCQVFTLHVLEYLFHLLNCYVSQMAFLRFLCFHWLVYTACHLWAGASGSPVPNLCHLSLKNDSPEHPSTPERQVHVIYFYRQATCDWIGLCRAWGWAVGGGAVVFLLVFLENNLAVFVTAPLTCHHEPRFRVAGIWLVLCLSFSD